MAMALTLGHRVVDNPNHPLRDCAVGEESFLARTGNGPANRAPGNDLALAVDFSCCRDGEYAEGLVETRRRYQFHRDDALPAVCTPGRPPITQMPAPATDARFVPGLKPNPTADRIDRICRRPLRARCRNTRPRLPNRHPPHQEFFALRHVARISAA